METSDMVRPEPFHQHYYQYVPGSRASGDIVGAVGGCFRAEHCELVFSHRHTLLTSNRITPPSLAFAQAEGHNSFCLGHEGYEAALYIQRARI